MRSSLIVVTRRVAIQMHVGVVAISMICASAMQFVDATPKSVEFEVQTVAAIVESPTSIGVADPSLYFSSPQDIDATLDALQSMGVQNVRVQIPWAAIQTWDPTSYDWTAADYMVHAAAERNMGILGVLNATPFWAGSPYLSGRPDPQVYATFASAVASRYAGEISAYEIWNEPNASTSLSPLDPAGYTQLLKAAYPAIKAADPSATVIGGVVGAVLSVAGLTMSPQDFIAGMYAAGARGSFDALSFHPYEYYLPFSAGAPVSESPLNQLAAIRQLMVANGDAALKIWATEYGQPTSVVSELQQAAYIKDFLTTWQTEAGAGPIFLDTTRDSTYNINVNDALGLFTADWTPKLAVEVVKNFIAGISDSTPAAVAVDAITALIVVVNQVTGIPLRIVAYVVGVVRDVVNTISAAVQGVGAFVQGVVSAFKAALTPPATVAMATTPAHAESSARTAAVVAAATEPVATQHSTVMSGQDGASSVTPAPPADAGRDTEERAPSPPTGATAAPAPAASSDEPEVSDAPTNPPSDQAIPAESPARASSQSSEPETPSSMDEPSGTTGDKPASTTERSTGDKSTSTTEHTPADKSTSTTEHTTVKSTHDAGSDSPSSKGVDAGDGKAGSESTQSD